MNYHSHCADSSERNRISAVGSILYLVTLMLAEDRVKIGSSASLHEKKKFLADFVLPFASKLTSVENYLTIVSCSQF